MPTVILSVEQMLVVQEFFVGTRREVAGVLVPQRPGCPRDHPPLMQDGDVDAPTQVAPMMESNPIDAPQSPQLPIGEAPLPEISTMSGQKPSYLAGYLQRPPDRGNLVSLGLRER
jgi:hypothetical protein